MNFKLMLHSYVFYWQKKLRALHALEDLEPLFEIFYTFVFNALDVPLEGSRIASISQRTHTQHEKPNLRERNDGIKSA